MPSGLNLRFACVALGALAISATCAADLVQNGGFETGDFTGWDTTLSTGATTVLPDGFVHGSVTYHSNSGTYFAGLGSNVLSDPSIISQEIATTSGQSYDVSFWLASDGLTGNYFDAQFGSTTIFQATDLAAQAYTEYSETIVATSSLTELSFASNDVPGYLSLDDVSVTPSGTPEPFTLGLAGFGLICAVRRSRKS